MGILDVSTDGDYADVRWRVLIGHITREFSPSKALATTHLHPDTPYGAVVIDEMPILSISDSYRAIPDWGDERLALVFEARFGAAFALPFSPKGIRPFEPEEMLRVMTLGGPALLDGRLSGDFLPDLHR